MNGTKKSVKRIGLSTKTCSEYGRAYRAKNLLGTVVSPAEIILSAEIILQ